MSNPVMDAERVEFLAARSISRHMLLPAWPRQVKEFPMVEVEVDWVRFSTLNHRTKAEQLREIHRRGRLELFTADPLGAEAQDAQYSILKSQAGFIQLKDDLRERGQQEPAVLSAEGVLINGNRRSAALRSLYFDDNVKAARYVRCLVLPADATPQELVDLEAELQVAQDFKEDYSWVNAAMLIEELYEREGKDFVRVAKRMHRDVTDVRRLYDKLQQLHQLVSLSKGARLHIDFEANESAFDELAKHIRSKPKPEAESVRATYFLGTLAGVNYRKLRHLQRADASDLVLRELADDKAFAPVLEKVAEQTRFSSEPDALDDLLGGIEKTNELSDVLAFLAAHNDDEVLSFKEGDRVSVRDVYRTIQSAIVAAADEAEEEERDQSAVTAPVVRASKAVAELERAAQSLEKARTFESWNEADLQIQVDKLERLVGKLRHHD